MLLRSAAPLLRLADNKEDKIGALAQTVKGAR